MNVHEFLYKMIRCKQSIDCVLLFPPARQEKTQALDAEAPPVEKSGIYSKTRDGELSRKRVKSPSQAIKICPLLSKKLL